VDQDMSWDRRYLKAGDILGLVLNKAKGLNVSKVP